MVAIASMGCEVISFPFTNSINASSGMVHSIDHPGCDCTGNFLYRKFPPCRRRRASVR